MRVLRLILAVLVFETLSVSAQGSAGQATLIENDTLAGALWRLAVTTNTRIGFEATDHVKFAGNLNEIPELRVATLEDGLHALVRSDGPYEWRKIGDFIVVRPKVAWDDLSNPFNRSTRGVQVTDETVGRTLLGIRDYIYTNTFASSDPKEWRGPTVSFDVQAGTVVDALNHLVIAADCILWVVAYRPLGSSERWPQWDLSLDIRTAKGRAAYSGSRPGGGK